MEVRRKEEMDQGMSCVGLLHFAMHQSRSPCLSLSLSLSPSHAHTATRAPQILQPVTGSKSILPASPKRKKVPPAERMSVNGSSWGLIRTLLGERRNKKQITSPSCKNRRQLYWLVTCEWQPDCAGEFFQLVSFSSVDKESDPTKWDDK